MPRNARLYAGGRHVLETSVLLRDFYTRPLFHAVLAEYNCKFNSRNGEEGTQGEGNPQETAYLYSTRPPKKSAPGLAG